MLEVLHAFRDAVDANPQVLRLVKGWNSRLLLEASDTRLAWEIGVRDGRIAVIREVGGIAADEDDEATLRIAASEAVLRGVFEGRINGIRANNDGSLEIYGAMTDQIRLDAIALILWGD